MKPRSPRSLIVSIALQALAIAVSASYRLWLPYLGGAVTAAWAGYLWAAILSAAAGIAGNAYMLVDRSAAAYFRAQILQTAGSLVAIVAFLAIFPFDFGAVGAGWVDSVLKGIVVFALVVGTIALIVNIVKAVRGEDFDAPATGR
jgi:hypothetical protein